MKKLTCEVCGSTEIKKEDSVYVCESCGCKYSIDDVRKLLVEGDITVNENHNYNINHEVSGQVEIVEQDNTVENINKIIDSYDREVKYAKSQKERLESWNKHRLLFEQGKFLLEHPELPETWLGLLYLQTVGFTFDRETGDEICKKNYEVALFKEDGDEAYMEEPISIFNDENEEYTYSNYGLSCFTVWNHKTYDRRVFLYDKIAIQMGFQNLCFHSSKEIFDKLEEIYNRPDTTQQQKDKINDYQKRHEELVKELRRKYNPKQPQKSSSNYTSQSSYSGQSSGGCYIATAVYGTYDCPEVWTLRRYRDNCLAKTWYGRTFIYVYYAISPTLVKWFGNTNWFKGIWRGKLDNMVDKLQNEGYLSTPYEDKE